MATNISFRRYETTQNLEKEKSSFSKGDLVFDKEKRIIYIVTSKTDTSVVLEPYYGGNTIKKVSVSGATITVTFEDNTTSSITVDNVANAVSASKLANKRTIALGTAVTSTAQGFDGSANITIPVNSVKESYLVWGGKNFNGDVSPVGAALSAEHSANRIALINGDALTIEYSTDGGSTWTDSGFTTDEKTAFCTSSSNVLIGRAKGQNSTACTTNSKTRITLAAQNGTNSYLYTSPRKLLLNVSTAWTTRVLIETKTGVSGATWSTFGTYDVSGWSAWNDIPLMLGTLGGDKTQTGNTWYLRLTFSCVSINSSLAGKYDSTAAILGMRLFGVTDWGPASTYAGKGPMSSTGHLYSYDTNANATFPATVTAKSFSGELAGNSATATRASSVGTDNSMKLYAQYNNEINFGGTNTSGVLYFGYRAADSKSVPTSFIFGGSNGTATLTANGFKKKDSSDSYVLTGGGGHSKISDLSVGYATASGACSGNAATATKLNNALTIGSKTYNGSAAVTITANDLGLSSALKFLGTTTTELKDASTTNPIVIGGASVTATTGNVVLYEHLEFLWNGSSWEELGDEKSFALKTVQIKGGSGLTGGGALDGDVTISHADTSSQASVTTGGRTYINSITLDDYGHVTALGTGKETDQTDISGNAATATKAGYATYLTFEDKRNDYPGNIVTSGKRVGGSFMTNTKLGISNNGSYSDAIIIRGYGDSTGGPDNALIFNKGSENVWHTQFAFGSTTTWGTPKLFLDSANFNSYAPKLNGTGATGTWGIDISGTASYATNIGTSSASLSYDDIASYATSGISDDYINNSINWN